MTQPLALIEVGAIEVGTGRTIEVEGRRYAVFNCDGAFHVIDDSCPHRGGPLGGGYIEGCEVYCPIHGWAFDVRTGACKSNPGRPVRTYSAQVRDGTLWIER
ncbi:MAG: Rieske (2Fe-2S) protein [Pedosphaera sp.]|nr:Rieske (2Fe-2S) protein [Pedosphaera sp.]